MKLSMKNNIVGIHTYETFNIIYYMIYMHIKPIFNILLFFLFCIAKFRYLKMSRTTDYRLHIA